MSFLALIEKWKPDVHGHNQEDKYLAYMKTKYLLMEKIEPNINNNAKLIMEIKNIQGSNRNISQIAIVKKKYLKFRGRHFAVINNGLIKLQIHWKKYYTTYVSNCFKITNELPLPREINSYIHAYTTQQYL
jgi:hypothetical protein